MRRALRMGRGLLLLWPLLSTSPTPAEEIDIRVQGAAGRTYKVAVQYFEPDAGSIDLIQTFYAELTDALEFSGEFARIPHAAFLEPRTTENYADVRMTCENWRGIGADALVQGRIERISRGARVRYRLWDVPRCQLVGDPAYLDGTIEGLWVVARRVADEIVERFTGRRGVAATQLTFVSDNGGNKEIYVMEADGTRKRRVTANGGINLFPAWSPKGEQILYTSLRAGSMDLWTISRGDRESRKLSRLPYEKYRGVFGPSPGWVTFVMNRESNTDLYRAQIGGRGLERLTRSRAIDVSPSWSPDGARLAFASDRAGSQQIYVLDTRTGQTRRLTFEGDYNASPAWSPTGEWIAFAARAGNNIDIYLIDPETRYTIPLVTHPRSDEEPSWSPDGRKIAFTSNRRGRKEIYAIDSDGRNLRRLSESFGNSSSPAWSTWLE